MLDNKTDGEFDYDDCLDLDVSVLKKPKQDTKPAPQKNTEMQLRVSNRFLDKDNKGCVLVTMKTNFYTLKANALSAVLKLFFESILQGKKEQKRLFGGCWIAKERKEPFSKKSEVKMHKNQYQQYVAVLKVSLHELDVAAAVSSTFYVIRSFMRNKLFPQCYTACMEEIFGSNSSIVSNLKEPTWNIFKNIDMQFNYSVPMDALVHDEDIYRVIETVTGLNKVAMFDCEDLKHTIFKNFEEKRN